jgi:hypothetical protein
MYEQHLHVQHNSSTSGYYATRVLQGYSSRNTIHTVLPKLSLATEHNITAQRNTVGHKKSFNETPYISSPKGMEEA